MKMGIPPDALLRRSSGKTLIPGEYTCHRIAQNQTHHGQSTGYTPEVVAHIAFHIQALAHAIFEFDNGLVKLLALLSRPSFKNFYRQSRIHAAFVSFWIQIWSCFNTSMVRVGVIFTALMRLRVTAPTMPPITA